MKCALLAAALIAGLPAPAHACGTCVFAVFDRIAPPVGWWFVVAVAWFVATSIVISLARVSFAPVPRIVGALAAVVLTVFSTAVTGPLLGFLLGALALVAFARAWRRDPPPVFRHLRRLGIVATIALVVVGVRGAHVASTRSDGDFVVQWEGTVAADQVFTYLAADPVRNRAELQKVALLGNGRLAERARAMLDAR